MLLPEEYKIHHFYKYRPINESTIKLLTNHELYFASPLSFNDPFDCKVDFIYEPKCKADWIKWIKGNNWSIEKKEKAMAYLNYDTDKFSNTIKSSIDKRKLVESFGITCFTTLNDNILMWSHYADQHYGICLGFKTKIQENSIGIEFEEPLNYYPAFKVDYDSGFPFTINLLADEQNEYVKFFISKHNDWKYEKEYRFILDENNYLKRNFKFKKSTLDEVIFGIRVSESNKNLIKNIIRKFYTDEGFTVNFYQAKEAERDYALIIEKDT